MTQNTVQRKGSKETVSRLREEKLGIKVAFKWNRVKVKDNHINYVTPKQKIAEEDFEAQVERQWQRSNSTFLSLFALENTFYSENHIVFDTRHRFRCTIFIQTSIVVLDKV